MSPRTLALIFGSGYALVGLLGFLPGVNQGAHAGMPPMAVDTAYGNLFGLFPVNIVHNLVHLAVGLWGMAAYRSLSAARMFGRANAVLFGLLTIMGLIPGLNTMFGIVPLFGHDIWLHALTTALAAAIGWMPAPEHHRQPTVETVGGRTTI